MVGSEKSKHIQKPVTATETTPRPVDHCNPLATPKRKKTSDKIQNNSLFLEVRIIFWCLRQAWNAWSTSAKQCANLLLNWISPSPPFLFSILYQFAPSLSSSHNSPPPTTSPSPSDTSASTPSRWIRVGTLLALGEGGRHHRGGGWTGRWLEGLWGLEVLEENVEQMEDETRVPGLKGGFNELLQGLLSLMLLPTPPPLYLLYRHLHRHHTHQKSTSPTESSPSSLVCFWTPKHLPGSLSFSIRKSNHFLQPCTRQ